MTLSVAYAAPSVSLVSSPMKSGLSSLLKKEERLLTFPKDVNLLYASASAFCRCISCCRSYDFLPVVDA